MRARIALLEGEKRGSEGILRDLSRRCRMLEGALKGERWVVCFWRSLFAGGCTDLVLLLLFCWG